jgi:hypothetical protein
MARDDWSKIQTPQLEIAEEYLVEEAPHILATVAVNLAARNPYVWGGTVIVHAGYHLYSKYLSESSSESYQQNGGSEGTETRPVEYRPVAARSVIRTGGRRSGSKPRKNTWERCPPGYYWDGKKCRKTGTGPNWY